VPGRISSARPGGSGVGSTQVSPPIHPAPPRARATWCAMKGASGRPSARPELIEYVVSTIRFGTVIGPIRTGVKKGEGLTYPIQNTGVFPPLAIHLLRVGEESGKLDVMLLQIADTYDADVRQAIQRLIALFEPLMILVMGIVIGTMVVSMLWSIFSINDVPF
jgi:hypothetical protein